MKLQDKTKYIIEAKNLANSIDMNALITDPNNLQEIRKINRLVAIFSSYLYEDGKDLNDKFLIFQKRARSSTHKGTVRNRATDVIQFIDKEIQHMDVNIIEEPIKANQDRIINKLKDEKLWIRTSLEGKDLHVFVGERESKTGDKVHIISDSESGAIRFDSKDQHPSELLERVVSLVTRSGGTIGVTQYGIKTTTEFINSELDKNKDIPITYATNIRESGGSNGHQELITLKNIGKSIALDVNWGIRGFAYEWKSPDENFELEPNKEREVIFPLSKEMIFTSEVPELNITTEYKDSVNNAFFTRREIKQTLVPSKAFYIFKPGNFFPPALLVNDGLEMTSEPFINGDRVESTFKVNTSGGVKNSKIGLSGSLLAILELTTDTQIKNAILELAHRKIRTMVKSNNVVDYLFSTEDLPKNYTGGFSTYTTLRDSIV